MPSGRRRLLACPDGFVDCFSTPCGWCEGSGCAGRVVKAQRSAASRPEPVQPIFDFVRFSVGSGRGRRGCPRALLFLAAFGLSPLSELDPGTINNRLDRGRLSQGSKSIETGGSRSGLNQGASQTRARRPTCVPVGNIHMSTSGAISRLRMRRPRPSQSQWILPLFCLFWFFWTCLVLSCGLSTFLSPFP